MSISLLRRLLMKEAVKDTAGSSGIMSINKNIADKVEQQVQRYVNDAMRQGVDLDTLSPEQLKMIVQMNKPKPPRVIAGDSPEGKGIMEALLGKQGEVVDMAGKKLDTSQGIMGGKSVKELMDSGQVTKGARGMKKSKKVQDREMFQDANKRLKTDVNKIIADIKAMDPMDSMKEANSVIGRKGVYKNLTPEESKKILKDTEDHIFERDIPEEDFADGGVAGLLGERPGYAIGNMVDQEDLGLGNLAEEDEYDFSDIEGQTAFIGLPEIFALGTKVIGPMLKGGSASAVLKNAAKEKLKREIGKKIYKGIQKKINKPKYGTQGPTTTTTTRPGRPGGGGDIGGNKNVGGGNTATNALGQTASQATKAGTGTSQGYSQHFAQGGPAYFFRLVEKIKFMGDDAVASKDKAIAKTYKDYTMEEDFSGNIEIIKKSSDEYYPEDVYMSYKVDEVPLKGKKGSTKVEEYEEYTARPDEDGKMKDVEPGVPNEVIDEAGDTTAMTLKKADGGIARMLGE
jgi:hypothetical protein